MSVGRGPARPTESLHLSTIPPAVGRRAWLIFVVLVAVLVAAPVAHAQTVRVHFLQGELTVALERPGATPADAVAALLAGPFPAEQRNRIVSELPAGLALLGLGAADGVVTVDFGSAFGDGDA